MLSDELALLWKLASKIEIKSVSCWYIDVYVDCNKTGDIRCLQASMDILKLAKEKRFGIYWKFSKNQMSFLGCVLSIIAKLPGLLRSRENVSVSSMICTPFR